MKMQNYTTTHQINKWDNWSVELDNAIKVFKRKYGVLPSYISANEHTHSQIDFITNISAEKKSVQNIKLTHLIFEKQFIDLVYDSNTKDKIFELEYDSFFEFQKHSAPKTKKNVTILQCC